MRIPREIIDEIVARSDIEEVIGSYVRLKRAGSNFSGLCPFHSEKTPSFTVFPATSSFYCFGCGAGGDVITFVMRAENLEYVQAVEQLASRAGVTIPEDTSKPVSGPDRKRVWQMNLDAAKFFRECLFDPAIGGEGLRYLTEQRKLSAATIKHFGLGFAPNDFGALKAYMNRLGYRDEELMTGFLCGKSQKTGRPFDYFRNRIIFPIIDTAGNVIAFGGRVMDDSKPKYLNTSDTPGFKKSRNLFALNYAKKCCSEQMILCEGYMDVIALHAAGFENAVATLGTAITEEQARLFAKYTKKVIITYDSDMAGQNAASRALRFFGEVGVEVRVLKLSGAKDPDEYIRTFGADAFRKVLAESRTEFDYKLEGILARYDIAATDQKVRAANEACSLIAGFPSAVEREVYIGQACSVFGLTADTLLSTVERIRRKQMNENKQKESRTNQLAAMHVGDRVNPDAMGHVRAAGAEETVLGLLLIFPEYRDSVASGKTLLAAADFKTEFSRRVFETVMALHTSAEGFSEPLLGETFAPDEMGRIHRMIRTRLDLSANGPEVLAASIAVLHEEQEKQEAKTGGTLSDVINRLRDQKKKQNSDT